MDVKTDFFVDDQCCCNENYCEILSAKNTKNIEHILTQSLLDLLGCTHVYFRWLSSFLLLVGIHTGMRGSTI